jgi:hypothetical protein
MLFDRHFHLLIEKWHVTHSATSCNALRGRQTLFPPHWRLKLSMFCSFPWLWTLSTNYNNYVSPTLVRRRPRATSPRAYNKLSLSMSLIYEILALFRIWSTLSSLMSTCLIGVEVRYLAIHHFRKQPMQGIRTTTMMLNKPNRDSLDHGDPTSEDGLSSVEIVPTCDVKTCH